MVAKKEIDDFEDTVRKLVADITEGEASAKGSLRKPVSGVKYRLKVPLYYVDDKASRYGDSLVSQERAHELVFLQHRKGAVFTWDETEECFINKEGILFPRDMEYLLDAKEAQLDNLLFGMEGKTRK